MRGRTIRRSTMPAPTVFHQKYSKLSKRTRFLVLLLSLLVVVVTADAKKHKPTQTEPQTQTCASGDGTCSAEDLEDSNHAPKVQPTADADTDGFKTQSECGLYLAASTIPGAGLGIFSGIDKEPGDTVGTGDVCLPVLEAGWHNEGTFFNPFSDYYWAGAVMGMHREVESDDVEAYCPGLDCAINCHLGLINVLKSVPAYDTAGLHRAKDPGAGGFTPYHNGTTTVSRAIPAGGELFKFYGDNWFETRPSSFGPTFPLSDDYPAAEELLRKLMALELEEDSELLKDVYDFIKFFKQAPNSKSRVLGALPDNLQDALHVAESDFEIAVLHQPAATRSLEWLHDNGRCLDNIRPGMSTQPQAGHGAFATRFLQKDSIVTTSPLHHLPKKEFVNMYNFELDQESNRWLRNLDDIVGYQLLLNYCFGHPDTSLLLCPYGAAINYINHSNDRAKANVKIQWADDFPLAHNKDALEETVESLEWNYKPQLGFDYVAIQDIEEGDELFLDYGDDWEHAWQDHVDNYQAVGDHPEQYAAGVYLNEHFGDMPMRTVEEQVFDPYPAHLQIRCHEMLRYEYEGTSGYDWRTKDYGYPCRILDRYLEDNQEWYTVQLEIRASDDDEEEDDDDDKTVTWLEKTDVPRSALAFFDKPGESDMHMDNAFRHAIGIPDDMIPDLWRNNLED